MRFGVAGRNTTTGEVVSEFIRGIACKDPRAEASRFAGKHRAAYKPSRQGETATAGVFVSWARSHVQDLQLSIAVLR